ncbi:hypothetical protein BROSI_B0013 [Candidatus Brocadia sinica JPN1]|uniref:Uncharacterized protein n=1 Tax=Candidatus Brocadia sinica JPN1 TaxID=1197129 RepID=A0ABQ0K2U3_9BACT|nr:hypothetical protein BROSI_B0013 [Candidatus Brocadia sinica JPN1]
MGEATCKDDVQKNSDILTLSLEYLTKDLTIHYL